MRVAIVDYGMGNLASVAEALRQLGAETQIAGGPDELDGADAIVLPGVGAFAPAMTNLIQRGFAEALDQRVRGDGVPFLGICLGMQLLARRSPEGGETAGLGWIDADVVALEDLLPAPLPVPHVGWNRIDPAPGSRLFARLEDGATLYFDHSYAIADGGGADAGGCTYGARFCAALEQDNLFAVQCHPEKSQRSGLILLRCFLNAASGVSANAA